MNDRAILLAQARMAILVFTIAFPLIFATRTPRTLIDQLPHWLETVGEIFPLYHLALGLQTTLSPDAKGSGLRWEPQAGRA